MDLLKILRSIEELLFELATWLILYPRTMLDAIVRPHALLASAAEKSNEESDADDAYLSPTLFLLLSILIAHVVEITVDPPMTYNSPIIGEVVKSDQALLLLRGIVYSIFPLMYARDDLARRGVPRTRATLRAPFMQQCYIVAPFAMAEGLASDALRTASPPIQTAGLVLSIAAIVWFLTVQTTWLRRSGDLSRLRATVLVCWSAFKSVVWIAAAAYALA